jgi:four helix bundle protein
MSNLELEKLEVYQRAMVLGERIHDIVILWKFYYRSTMGKQLMESCDSIAANISEGYGRYFYKENRNFCYYARGSLAETKTWIVKANKRNLIPETDFNSLLHDLAVLHIKLIIISNP